MANTPTLTKAMLADLMKGNASISLLECPANGEVTFANLDFDTADQIFSVKDSFTITPADVSQTNLQIDQMDEIIDTVFEEGDYVMNANIPSMATAVMDYFFNSGATISQLKGQDGTTTYDGKGYAERKEKYASVLIESASKNTAICFARVRVTVNPPARDNNTDPAYLKFTGTIVANLKAGQGNYAVLRKHTTP